MAGQLVVGIFPSSDVAELEKSLGAVPGIERDQLRVFTAGSPSQGHDESFLNFTHVESGVSADISADPTHGTGLIMDSGGTDVPGITDLREPSLSDFEEPEVVPHYLGSLPIPSDEVENYDEAIADGRSVVVYPTSADAESAQLRQALRTAGLRNVQVFQTK